MFKAQWTFICLLLCGANSALADDAKKSPRASLDLISHAGYTFATRLDNHNSDTVFNNSAAGIQVTFALNRLFRLGLRIEGESWIVPGTTEISGVRNYQGGSSSAWLSVRAHRNLSLFVGGGSGHMNYVDPEPSTHWSAASNTNTFAYQKIDYGGRITLLRGTFLVKEINFTAQTSMITSSYFEEIGFVPQLSQPTIGLELVTNPMDSRIHYDHNYHCSFNGCLLPGFYEVVQFTFIHVPVGIYDIFAENF